MLARILTFLSLTALFAGCTSSSTLEKNFFNGKDLTGWSAANMQYWSVEDSVIIGKADKEVDRNQFLWSDIKVKDFYLSLDVKLDSADRNAGIQFRSQKINDYGQAMGYQADIGLNYGHNIWGTLYYEDGRGLLHTSDPTKTTLNTNGWNHYEILAVKNRIWIAVNGKIISAVDDKGGDKEGYIALQIHSGPAQTVHYKIKELIHNPEISIAGKKEDELNKLLHKPLVPVPGYASIDIKPGDTIAFAGGTNIVNMSDDGYLETLLSSYYKKSKLKFRNLGWEGDQVYEQFRDIGFGDWFTNIDSLNASTVFVQFGQMEVLQGAEKLNDFLSAYKKILDTLKATGKQIVILSPIDFEPALSNDTLKHTSIQQYFNAIQLMAQMEGYPFVDLYYTLPPGRTYDGIHLNAAGHKAAAEIIMKSLGIGTPYTEEMEILRGQIIKKNKIWYEYWRPGNWAFLKGDRMDPQFSRHWKDYNHRIFPEEIAQYQQLLQKEEKNIELILSDGKLTEENKTPTTRSSPIDDNTIAEELASFKLNENYNIELYASEALGIADPCAMRWDEKGRLWVLCIPTYPQPSPGQPADDKLIVLEDKNKDGRADASTVFAEGLNIPLGFELGNNGVYLGEQTKLLFLKDTNNDLKYDSKQVLLSGFGTHDSHQTINSFTWSPGGELFFAQGLSIHSYVETPFGVKKANRGAIWRYRPRLQQLDNIVDQSTASDNPWGITFGNWGEMFSKSNDTGIYFTSPAFVLSEHKTLIPEIGATHIKSGIVEIPRSSHLPEDIRNDILIAGYYNNKIERLKIKEAGAGYKATLIEPLLSSTGKNFRPVDIKTGPDGAIYILDWYNPIIGHYQASMRDPERDRTHGRIWKITAKNRPLLKAPDLYNQSAAVLLDALKSDEYWVRYQARRLLSAKPATEVLSALEKWIPTTRNEHDLMEALAIYENFETINQPLLEKLLRSSHPGARAYAVQVAGRWSDRIPESLRLIKPLLSDNHPRVRLMGLVACSNIHQRESMNAAVEILKYPMDKFTRHAFEKTVFALRGSWEPALKNNTFKFTSNEQLATVISISTPGWYTGEMYRKLLSSDDLAPDVEIKLLTALFSVDPSNYVTPATVNSIKKILNTTFPQEIVISAIKLVRSANIKELSPEIKKLALKAGQSDEVIAQGLTTLVNINEDAAKPILDKYISSTSAIVRTASINGYKKLGIDYEEKKTPAPDNTIPKEYDEQYVKSLAALVKKIGNASKGKQIYAEKLNCGTCHAINGKGGNIGPNLSAVGSGLSVQDIITEVLWPNKNIKEGYNSIILELKNGEQVQGIKVLENATSISVKATPSSSPVVYNKSEVVKTTVIGSAMPYGLTSIISEDELRDVIRYLSALRD